MRSPWVHLVLPCWHLLWVQLWAEMGYRAGLRWGESLMFYLGKNPGDRKWRGVMVPWATREAAHGENGASASPGFAPSAATEQSYSQVIDTLTEHFWFRLITPESPLFLQWLYRTPNNQCLQYLSWCTGHRWNWKIIRVFQKTRRHIGIRCWPSSCSSRGYLHIDVQTGDGLVRTCRAMDVGWDEQVVLRGKTDSKGLHSVNFLWSEVWPSA